MRRAPVVAALVLLSACGRDDASTTSAVDTVSSTITTSTTTAPTTTAPSTTVLSATTTTALEPLGVPEPPPNPRAPEPRIELGSIAIPRLELLAPLYEGVSLTTLDNGPGHWPGTAMPGHRGNVVVAGHRTSHSRPFRHLELLVPGDEVMFDGPEGRFVYTVMQTEIVTPDAMRIIEQADRYTATLFACHPVGSTKQRIVVHLALTQQP